MHVGVVVHDERIEVVVDVGIRDDPPVLGAGVDHRDERAPVR